MAESVCLDYRLVELRGEEQTTADGGTFEFDYDLDEAGKVEATTVTDPVGNQRKVEFNAAGLSVAETEAPETELEQTTSIERQPETGLALSKTDPLGRKSEFKYDGLGNVTEATRLAGSEDAVTTKFDYEPGTSHVTKVTDPLGHATEFEYGSHGELLKRTDALGSETSMKYNSEGQLTSVVNPEEEATTFAYSQGDLASVTDPLGRTTRQFVDALGRVRSITSPGGQGTLLSYNEADELIGVTAPSGAETKFSRDADGNVISITDALENETTMTYDAMDRLETETNPLEDTVEQSYDKGGHLVKEISRRGKDTEFDYDGLGRLARAEFGVEGEGAESSIEYEYDDADRLVGVGDSTSGEYVLAYDELDRLTEVSGPEGTVGYAYDDAGRRTALTLPGQEPLAYEYDDANRLTGITRGLEVVSLAYDDADRRTSVTLPNGIDQLYGYDKAGQATSITYKDGESTLGDLRYAYDANGRTEAIWGSYARLALPAAMEGADYNAANQLVERDGKELSYDADGNLIDDGTSKYDSNARGQLTGIDGPADAAFAYDPFGRRISKILGETTTDLLYDDTNVVQESVGGSTTASYLTDRLGSVIALADDSGEVDTTYTYEPFGTSATAGGPSTNPFQFTGRENDGTGLYYYRARYYSQSFGRFISEDPAGFVGSGPNLFWYANGDPLNLIDPSGECFPCIPDFNPIAPLEELADRIGDWVSDAPGVVREVAGRGGGEWIGDRGTEVGRTFTCLAETAVQQPGPVGCQEEAEQLGPEDPDAPEPPSFPPPGAPGKGPVPIPRVGR